jgi:tetratricopeptide (TPR) repeat protein/tRNA A-37 threonylcarbamoyl transferase component Bud32
MESLLGSTVRGIRLVDELARGGMGEVYLGFDERLQRKVAVKAIRGDRRLDAVARARFMREARVLSQLEHPNICRLYDLIESEDRDYLVMELAQGRNLRTLVGTGMSREWRLAVAIQVAEALVAAHSLSVVHRDLKPENVIVGDDGRVKVLDFGLARPSRAPEITSEFRQDGTPARERATSDSGGSDGTVTELGLIVGTPRYMSPEQARGEAVTAASDMYSFGLLIQEIFTDLPPIATDLDPPAMLQKAMWGESQPVAGLDAPLTALINRLKSLAPRDRPSAAETAERLRWIADAPRRRLRQAVRTGVAATLVAAAAISVIGLVQVSRARQRAEASEAAARRAQADAEAVNSFLRDMLTSPDPRAQGRDVKVVDVLARAAEGVDRDFAGSFTSQAAILDTLGSTYHALGELAEARPLLARAVELRRRELGEEAPETLASLHRLGVVDSDRAQYAEAEAVLRQALAGREKVLGPQHRDTLDTVMVLGRALQRDRKFEEARTLFRRGYDGRRQALGRDDPGSLEAALFLGSILTDYREWAEAETMVRESLEGARRTLGPSHPQALSALAGLGLLYSRQGKTAEAAAVYHEVVSERQRVLGPEHPQTLNSMKNLAGLLVELGQYQEGGRILENTLAIQRANLGPSHHETLETMRSMGRLAELQGRHDEADRIWRQRWAIAREHLGDEHRVTLECKSVVANAEMDRGRLAEAERLHREVLADRRRLFGEDHEATERSKKNLARLLAATGRLDEARALDPDVKAAPTPPAQK